jgi:hypothetical protein
MVAVFAATSIQATYRGIFKTRSWHSPTDWTSPCGWWYYAKSVTALADREKVAAAPQFKGSDRMLAASP